MFAAALLVVGLSATTAPAQKTKPEANEAKRAASRRVKQYTIEQFMDTVRIGGASFSPDEKQILFHSNKTGIFNVYTVPAAGGEASQLTESMKESTFAVSYFPADTRFIYTYDKGGNENSHLSVKAAGGTERDLTPGDKTKANFLGWSHDRKSFFYSTNERDARYFDVFEMTVADMKPALIFKDEKGYDFADISNDKRHIAFGKQGDSTTDSDIYLYDTQTKALKHVTPHKGEIAFAPLTFDPQSKFLYYLTDEESEFQYIKRHDLNDGNSDVVEKEAWDISSTYFFSQR
ncbi:MAG: hypothetical protein WKF84_06155 [Pyrinomonadaceae bacterium]